MIRSAFLSCILLLSTQAHSGTEYRLGGEGNSWQASLTEASVYQVFDGDGQVLRQEPVGLSPFGAGADTLIDFETNPGSIQPREIDPGKNIALADVNAGKTIIPLPYLPGSRVTTAACDHALHVSTMKLMLDGDPTTATFRTFVQRASAPPGVGNAWRGAVVFDFGGDVPINRIRFYPRLSQREDRSLIEAMEWPEPKIESFGEDSFLDNFLAWYEIRVGDNSITFAPEPCSGSSGYGVSGSSRQAGGVATSKRRTVLGNLRWVRSGDPLLTVLETTNENLDPVVDISFPTRSTRWLTLRAFPLRDYEVAEFEVYGEGFVPETTYVTPILDFGQAVTWGKIGWKGETPEGTRIEIRTRTGHSPDPNLYFAPNINDDLVQIDRDQYERIDTSVRLLPVHDVENWSFWSPPYEFATGLRADEATTWEDGTPLLSPSPSRYIQVAIKLFAAFDVPPRLDQLSLQLSETLSAQSLVGEIWPIEVKSFEPTPFTYVVLPTLKADNAGFDRLEILTHVRAQMVHSVAIDGEPIDLNQFEPDLREDRLILSFPPLTGTADNRKQIEVKFDVPVLRFGTEFRGWVFNSTDPDQIRQSIDPGNATYTLAGDLLAVNTPVGGELLVDVEVTPVFTPNGDGINDNLKITYKLREVTATRPLVMRIYDLAGDLVTALPVKEVRSGTHAEEWDGRNAQGDLVPPGLYLYELSLESVEQHKRTGTFALAY